MTYIVVIQKRVIKFLEKVDEPYYTNIKQAILRLADDPRPPGYLKLRGREGYRIRVGNYRIIYRISDDILQVDVVELGHRKDIYE